MFRSLLFAALLCAGSVRAQTVILKCVDAKGHVTFTNETCAPGEHVKDARAYAPTRDDPVARERLREIEQQQDSRNRWTVQQAWQPSYSPQRAPTEREKRLAACEHARKEANDARGKGWNSSTLVYLDRLAVDACSGL